ncbi:MAG: hypothetical protein ACKOFU_01830, partial [Actinomycetota bacterium]
ILLYQAPILLGSDRRFTAGIALFGINQQIRLRSEEITEFDGDIKRLLFLDTRINEEVSCSPA